MPKDYSLTELFGPSVNYNLEDLFAPSVYSMDDLFGAAKRQSDAERYNEEINRNLEEESVGGFFEQMGRGFMQEASLGLSKYLYEDEEPAGTWESLARGIGRFGGFLAGPIKGAKAILGVGGKTAAKIAGKGGVKAVQAALAAKGAKGALSRTAQHVGRGALHLGTAEAISDITDIPGMPGRFAHGAKIGTIYGLAGMTHIFKNAGVEHVWRGKVMNLALSQLAGRAMLGATGEWSLDMFKDADNLPEAIFHEALNTFFLSKGIHPMNILTGEVRPYQSKMLKEHNDWVMKARKLSKAKDGIEIPKEMFHREVLASLDPYLDLDVMRKRLNLKEVERHLKAMKANPEFWEDIWGRPQVRWNSDLNKHEPAQKAELLQAFKEFNAWRETNGWEPIEKVPVVIISSSPETLGQPKTPVIPTSIDVALRALGKNVMSAEMVAEIQGAKNFAYNVKTQELRVIKRAGRGVYAYQDATAEKIIHTSWDKANSYRFDLEGAGDIIREFGDKGKQADPNYIGEKLDRIDRLLTKIETRRLHPNDSLKMALDHVPEKVKALQKAYEAQPVTRKGEVLAKQLVLDLLSGDYRSARKVWNELNTNLDRLVKQESQGGKLKPNELLYEIQDGEVVNTKAHKLTNLKSKVKGTFAKIHTITIRKGTRNIANKKKLLSEVQEAMVDLFPEQKGLKIEISSEYNPNEYQGARSAYNKASDTIHIILNEKAAKKEVGFADIYTPEAIHARQLDAAIHEIVHGIQQKTERLKKKGDVITWEGDSSYTKADLRRGRPDGLVPWEREAAEVTERYIKKPKELARPTTVEKGMKAIEQFREAPAQPLPIAVDKWLGKKLRDLDISVTDIQAMYEAMGIEGRPKMWQLSQIEDRLYQMSKIPHYLRMPHLMEEFRAANELILYPQDTTIWGKGIEAERGLPWAEKKAVAGLKEKQLRDDVFHQQQAYDRVMRMKRASAKQEMGKGGSVLANLMKVGWTKRWLDIRKIFEHWTITTGLPFWEIGRQIKMGRHKVDRELEVLVEPLMKYKRAFTIKEELQLMEYWERKAERFDIAKTLSELSPRQHEFIATVDKIFENVRPNVSYYRMQNWLRLEARGQHFNVEKWTKLIKQGDKKGAAREAQKKVFQNEERPEVQEALEGAKSVRMMASEYGMTKEAALMQYATSGGGKGLGLLEEGTYLPRILLGRAPGRVSEGVLLEEYTRNLDTMNLTHLQSRGKLQGRWMEGELEHAAFVVDSYPLVRRVESYLRNVLNSTHLQPGLRTLDRLVSLFQDDFKQVKGMRGGFDFLAGMRLYAHRKKGLPLQVGGIGAALKGIQSIFFRVLTAGNPFLWMRNLFQSKVTHPNKEAMLDPRYWFKSYKKNIPEDVKTKVETDITQFSPIARDYLFTEEAFRAEKIPVLGVLYKLAKPVGKLYALTDWINRRGVFTNTFLRGSDYTNKYLEGKINVDYLEKRLALGKVDPLHRKYIRYLIASGQVEKAMYELGEWSSDNSQWVYERSEKSLHEMTSEGEVLTNLLTWTKSIIQQVRSGANIMYEGVQTGNDKKIVDGAKWMGGTMLVGQLANQILKNVSNKHGVRYNDYGLDMFFWEMGGVSASIAFDFTEALAEFATSVDEPEAVRGQAIAKLAKFADNTLIRQLVPFMKWSFSAVEAITGTTYIQPVQQLFLKKGLKKVDRTLIEGFQHALLTTDPSKSSQVRKWTHVQAVKFRSLANKAKSPPLRAWYEYRANRYKNLAEMFSRYEPIEVFESYRKRELEKFLKQFEEDAYFEDVAKMNMALARDMRKWEQGIF